MPKMLVPRLRSSSRWNRSSLPSSGPGARRRPIPRMILWPQRMCHSSQDQLRPADCRTKLRTLTSSERLVQTALRHGRWSTSQRNSTPPPRPSSRTRRNLHRSLLARSLATSKSSGIELREHRELPSTIVPVPDVTADVAALVAAEAFGISEHI